MQTRLCEPEVVCDLRGPVSGSGTGRESALGWFLRLQFRVVCSARGWALQCVLPAEWPQGTARGSHPDRRAIRGKAAHWQLAAAVTFHRPHLSSSLRVCCLSVGSYRAHCWGGANGRPLLRGRKLIRKNCQLPIVGCWNFWPRPSEGFDHLDLLSLGQADHARKPRPGPPVLLRAAYKTCARTEQ